jgi:hypothetical protein|tara:strand:+ start:6477 stop:6929 length:453 start_codon:yes stop_codon:yes gene_type:complete
MAEVQTRTNRETNSREKSARYVYTPSSTLPDPTPEPGYTFRWIATHVLGQADPTNVSRKMRDGYEPVKAADHPEMMVAGNEKTGNIEIGGLMLCKIPTERANAMSDYYNGQAQNQMDSVDNNFMRQNDPRMPLFADRKSTVTRGGFGKGS